jgi:hypothetical protein
MQLFKFILRLLERVSQHRGADKSLARPTSRYIFFDGENISFDASLVIYRSADKPLVRPGRKQATVTEDFELYPI